jgi:hypothetical protein
VGKKLTADSLGFAGEWSEIVSVSSDRGTRHVGQRPSEQDADSHCHHVSTTNPGIVYNDLHPTGAENKTADHSTGICLVSRPTQNCAE